MVEWLIICYIYFVYTTSQQVVVFYYFLRSRNTVNLCPRFCWPDHDQKYKKNNIQFIFLNEDFPNMHVECPTRIIELNERSSYLDYLSVKMTIDRRKFIVLI